MPSHYLNQWWPSSLLHICIIKPQCVKIAKLYSPSLTTLCVIIIQMRLTFSFEIVIATCSTNLDMRTSSPNTRTGSTDMGTGSTKMSTGSTKMRTGSAQMRTVSPKMSFSKRSWWALQNTKRFVTILTLYILISFENCCTTYIYWLFKSFLNINKSQTVLD